MRGLSRKTGGAKIFLHIRRRRTRGLKGIRKKYDMLKEQCKPLLWYIFLIISVYPKMYRVLLFLCLFIAREYFRRRQ